jgi:hypothetical protein
MWHTTGHLFFTFKFFKFCFILRLIWFLFHFYVVLLLFKSLGQITGIASGMSFHTFKCVFTKF